MSSWFCKSTPSYVSLDKSTIDYNTGDLILFSGTSLLDRAIRLCSKSKYSHCGIVLINPTCIDPALIGTYFIESTLAIEPDVEEHVPKFGITLHKLDDVLEEHKKAGDTIYVRKIRGLSGLATLDKDIKSTYEQVKDVPYTVNPLMWLTAKEVVDDPMGAEDFAAKYKLSDKTTQNVKSMWCSAFCGFFLSHIGVLDPLTPWSLLAPKHFSSKYQDLEFINGCSFDPEQPLNV